MSYFEPERAEERAVKNRRRVLIVLTLMVALFFLWATGSQSLWVWLNLMEFGELYLRPIYFEVVGGLVLSTVAFVRIDFLRRRSLVWWLLRTIIRIFRQQEMNATIPVDYLDFAKFSLGKMQFAAWQATKLLLGILIYRDALFGMNLSAMMGGWDAGLSKLSSIFALPFTTPPMELIYAQQKLVPLVPALTLIVGPLLGAIGLRLLVLVGITNLASIFTLRSDEGSTGQIDVAKRIPIIEGLLAVGLIWLMFNQFFGSFIDYNTRYVILGLGLAGALFAFFAVIDHLSKRVRAFAIRRYLTTRILAVFLIVLVIGSVMAINNSIADARKVEWRGPYVTQQIAVNRYLAQLDDVKEIPYNFSEVSVPRTKIDSYIAANKQLLDKVRLWDWDAAFAKLKPEIGLIPYIDFQDSDILRFNGSMFWSASMKPKLPESVRPEDRWYAQHLVYTHVPQGFLLLDAARGTIEDTQKFFKERQVYFGEGGLLTNVWVTFPEGRERSDEIGGIFYKGSGGLKLSPPLSWLFDLNFFWAFRDQAMRIFRYRDVFDRMNLLFPYFEYQSGGRRIDMLPVTDGEKSYWLMPLIVRLDANSVPWAGRSPLMRLVGYALIDLYTGNFKIIVTGDDFFSQLFKRVYSDYVVTDVPVWLRNQLRYPEELFEWRVSMYNFFHVTDASTFIVAKEFFEVPPGLDTYYIISKPPGFKEAEFVGLLSLELRGAGGRNLAGYMVVRNQYERLGELMFYKVPLESDTKLLGPTAVREALEKNSEFAQLRTLLRSPRLGDNILYRVGDHDVYFIPVYTAGAGGVVTELGVVAAVGGSFTGRYYIGMGRDAEEAFRALLGQPVQLDDRVKLPVERGVGERRRDISNFVRSLNLTFIEPITINAHLTFLEGNASYATIQDWESTKTVIRDFLDRWKGRADQLVVWGKDNERNVGILISNKGIIELHYVTINVR